MGFPPSDFEMPAPGIYRNLKTGRYSVYARIGEDLVARWFRNISAARRYLRRSQVQPIAINDYWRAVETINVPTPVLA